MDTDEADGRDFGVRGSRCHITRAAEAFGLRVLPCYPLASGLPTGKYSSGKALKARS
ncbi:hypothetical protein [Streptomyces sp. NPDC048710]|uniref:hypothetical protein n=1 Tax=unclassified Streptomyces TaxID=2593676 RepID=UPI00371926D7